MDLFDYAEEQAAQKRVRRRDPDTSQNAARSFKEGPSQEQVRAALRALGQATDEQILAWSEAQGATFSEQRLRTARNNLVERFGEVERCATGKTKRGNDCGVWRLVAEAVAS